MSPFPFQINILVDQASSTGVRRSAGSRCSPCEECSSYGGNLVAVARVVDVRPVALVRLPVAAGKGEEEKDERAQHHDAAAEVERQVVRLCVVEEPPWMEEKKESRYLDKCKVPCSKLSALIGF